MIPVQTMFPRNCCILGTGKFSSALIARSLSGTCGVVVFQSQLGNEGFIYVNGTQPSQVMFGGVNEVMTNPAGGIAIGGSITHPALPKPLRFQPGWITLGSERVSSSIFLRGSYTAAAAPVWIPPAVGLMNNNGTDVHYLFMTDSMVVTTQTLTLYCGTEADYKSPPGAAVSVAAIAASGGLSGAVLNWDTLRRDGRSTLSDSYRGFNAPLVIRSGGLSAALGLVTGDFLGATAVYVDPTTKVVTTSDLQTWYSWSGTTSFP